MREPARKELNKISTPAKLLKKPIWELLDTNGTPNTKKLNSVTTNKPKLPHTDRLDQQRAEERLCNQKNFWRSSFQPQRQLQIEVQKQQHLRKIEQQQQQRAIRGNKKTAQNASGNVKRTPNNKSPQNPLSLLKTSPNKQKFDVPEKDGRSKERKKSFTPKSPGKNIEDNSNNLNSEDEHVAKIEETKKLYNKLVHLNSEMEKFRKFYDPYCSPTNDKLLLTHLKNMLGEDVSLLGTTRKSDAQKNSVDKSDCNMGTLPKSEVFFDCVDFETMARTIRTLSDSSIESIISRTEVILNEIDYTAFLSEVESSVDSERTDSATVLKHLKQLLNNYTLRKPSVWCSEPILSEEDVKLLQHVIEWNERYNYLRQEDSALLKEILKLYMCEVETQSFLYGSTLNFLQNRNFIERRGNYKFYKLQVIGSTIVESRAVILPQIYCRAISYDICYEYEIQYLTCDQLKSVGDFYKLVPDSLEGSALVPTNYESLKSHPEDLLSLLKPLAIEKEIDLFDEFCEDHLAWEEISMGSGASTLNDFADHNTNRSISNTRSNSIKTSTTLPAPLNNLSPPIEPQYSGHGDCNEAARSPRNPVHLVRWSLERGEAGTSHSIKKRKRTNRKKQIKKLKKSKNAISRDNRLLKNIVVFLGQLLLFALMVSALSVKNWECE